MRRLSIILPVLDEAPRIGAQLASLQALRANGVELVVADGGSSDGTPACCAGLADRILGTARGRARQMNDGATASSGEILLFLHADTALPVQAVDAILRVMDDGAQWGHFDVRIDNQSLPFHERAFNAAYPLHTARFDNLGYKLLMTASGLLVAFISVLGLLGFVKSLRSAPDRKPSI